jgi:BASS family bile acid:Na+ symporter
VGDFRRIFTQPRALLVGVVCHFVLLPLACFLLLGAWGMTGVFAVGFMVLAAAPRAAPPTCSPTWPAATWPWR